MTETLSDFYDGKTIYITGAAGFLGTYLLQLLLSCLPGIVRIYILIRPKNGLDPMERKEGILKKKIFLKMKENNPELLDKVHVISGDISKPNLGMSDDDMRKICQEVTMVFHGAASVSFTQPYRSICFQNTKGTDHIIDLCRRLKKLDVLVYTSTAYANCHRHPKAIEEKVYTLPFSAERFLDEMENGTDESFDDLISSLGSKFNLNWPNSYTFSKCLAENVLLEKASDLPVAIVRPSIVFNAFKGARPGYTGEGSGITDLSVGVGKGFVRVIRGDNNSIFDVVPIDVVANCHVLIAWCVATGRRPSMFVVHNTLGDILKLKFGKYLTDMCAISRVYPLPNAFQEMSFLMVKSKLAYRIIALYRHYIPAAVLDLYLRYKGSKLRLVKLYRYFDTMTEKLYYFTSTTFNFKTVNLHGLTNELQPEEKELFYLDLGGASFATMVENMPFGSEIFNWETDKLSQNKRRHIVYVRTMVITFIQRFTLLLFILILYYSISKVFF